MRHPFSYHKVQKFISSLKRNIKVLNNVRSSKHYLDVGCGNNFDSHFLHLDFHWMPGVEVCWDFARNGLPFADNRFYGIFTEHCLEHIEYSSMPFVLSEFHRALKPGGTLRIVVPDGELYLTAFNQIKKGAATKLPYQGAGETPMERINGVFRNHGHQFIYDFETFERLLRRAGFDNVERKDFRNGKDKILLKDLEWRKIESLYLEAYKAE